MDMKNTEIAVFGGGCFWCTEAVFTMLRGVSSILPGYAGGTKPDPTYEEVCGGSTGHAEVIRIEFNPTVLDYRDLLTVFFATHDPTTMNRQGNDVGPQYRSVILYATPEQKAKAETYIKELDDASPGGPPIVTTVEPLKDFYGAEDYHKNYYAKNPDQAYCRAIITPKIKKAKERFAMLLKERS